MEVAGPDEGEHGTGERADEAHEDAEVWYEDGHEDGEDYDAYSPRQTPDLELVVQGPDSGKQSLGLAPKQSPLQELAGRVVGQRVREHRFYHQAEVHEALEARRLQVVRDYLVEK